MKALLDKIAFKLMNFDWNKWYHNTVKFFAPFILIFLIAIKSGVDLHDALYLVYGYALNVAIDLLTKFRDSSSQN